MMEGWRRVASMPVDRIDDLVHQSKDCHSIVRRIPAAPLQQELEASAGVYAPGLAARSPTSLSPIIGRTRAIALLSLSAQRLPAKITPAHLEPARAQVMVLG